ncbi:MAG: RtcB family protein [Candidatus Woesebacteria bacterium]|jgi:tRNA-splicing ligase RtcB
MQLIQSEAIPIKIWLENEKIEEGALEQAKHLANLAYAFHHVAIMPDVHQGYGMPIGGVMATKDYIVPNAVGVDIGCGMCAVRTSLKEIKIDALKQIMGKIREAIPVGFKRHPEKQDPKYMPPLKEKLEIVEQQYQRALTQIGTLGGGNHFIEIQKGSDGFIWIMVHSGSRNIGKQVADHYNRIAVELNKKSKKPIPKAWQLAALPIDSEVGKLYFKEMTYCVNFALANRQLMMERIQKIFTTVLGDINFDHFINIAHNYASFETHFGQKVLVHRKGATPAMKDQWGIIPGSQGSKSYIVKGKGNEDSFMSCSHGAGRIMGRKEARRRLNLEEEIRKLDEKGILHGIRGSRDLDEASGAYKAINQVMENQKDLVEIMVELSPLGVVKG